MLNDSIDNIRIDINREKSNAAIYVRKGDTKSRTIHCTIADNGKVVPLENAVAVEFMMKKPDGTEVDNGCIVVGNEIQYTLRTNDIAAPGEGRAQFSVTYDDGSVLTTPEFSIYSYEKILDTTWQESTNEYTALTANVAQAKEFRDQAEVFANSCNASADEIEEYMEEIGEIKADVEEAETNTHSYMLMSEEYKNKTQELYDNIGKDALKLGETSDTAFRGDLGMVAYHHVSDSDVHLNSFQKDAIKGLIPGSGGDLSILGTFNADDLTYLDYLGMGDTHPPMRSVREEIANLKMSPQSSGSGNAVTSITNNNGRLVVHKDATFVTAEALDDKQDKLTAGANITIDANNVISASGGGVTEATVAAWGFTKNTGDYTKPSTGIPATDLETDIQNTLDSVGSKAESSVVNGHISDASIHMSAAEKREITNIKNSLATDRKYFVSDDTNGATYIKAENGINVTNKTASEWEPVSAQNMYIYPNGSMVDVASELSNKATKTEMNNKGKVKFIGTIYPPPSSGQTSVNATSIAVDLTSYSQVYIEVTYYSGVRTANIIIPKNLLSATAKLYTTSAFYNTSNFMFAEMSVKITEVKCASVNSAGSFGVNWIGVYGIY